MRTITKDIQLTVDGTPLGFRLTLYARMMLPEGTSPSGSAVATAGQSCRAVASKK